MQEIERGDIVLIQLMINVDEDGLQKVVSKALSEIDDKVAYFHEIIKPDHPKHKGLLETWKKETELKKQIRAKLNESVEEAQGN